MKIAFFPDPSATESSPEVPTGELAQPQIEVTLGSVINEVTLEGTVSAVEAVPMPASVEGTVTKLWVTKGDSIKKGAPVLEVRSEKVDDEGEVTASWATMYAPADGRVSSLTALVGQSFAIGDPIAQIAPSAYYVSGSIPPDQLYRLIKKPKSATVTIAGGPAPFECTQLAISSPLAGADAEVGAAGGPMVTCSVPRKVTVFPGLTAKIAIPGGSADGVLVVPTTAVEGIAGSGNVYVLTEDGAEEPKPVKLGLTDGTFVEITEGLAEGDMILEFVPGAQNEETGEGGMECYVDPEGNEICEEILL